MSGDEVDPIASGDDAPDASGEDAPTGDDVDDGMDAPTGGAELLHGVPVAHSGPQVTLHPHRDRYRALVEELRNEGYWVCVDLCGVDYLTYDADRSLPEGVEPQRFEVVVGLLDPGQRRRLRLRVQVPAEDPRIDSIVAVHPGVDAFERETWDLFGVVFEGHPGLTRILLPDEWVGHPLRKDVPVGAIPVQFKATRELRR